MSPTPADSPKASRGRWDSSCYYTLICYKMGLVLGGNDFRSLQGRLGSVVSQRETITWCMVYATDAPSIFPNMSYRCVTPCGLHMPSSELPGSRGSRVFHSPSCSVPSPSLHSSKPRLPPPHITAILGDSQQLFKAQRISLCHPAFQLWNQPVLCMLGPLPSSVSVPQVPSSIHITRSP